MESSATHYSLSTVIKTEPIIELDNGNSIEVMTDLYPASQAALYPSDLELQTDQELMRREYSSFNCTSNDFPSNEVYLPAIPNSQVDQESMFISVPLLQNTPEALDKGNTTIDGISKLHSCSYCARTFAKASGLYGHIRVHRAGLSSAKRNKNLRILLPSKGVSYTVGLMNGKLPSAKNSVVREHACKLCDKAFIYRRNLRTHEINKHGAKKLKDLPKKGSLSNSLLASRAAHTSTHTASSKYNCQNCGRLFSSLTTRKRHEEWHCFNSVKCPCPYCPKSYARIDYIKLHVKLVHPSMLDSFLSAMAEQKDTDMYGLSSATNAKITSLLKSQNTTENSDSISPQKCPDERSKIDMAPPGGSRASLSPSSKNLSKVASPAICTTLDKSVSSTRSNNDKNDLSGDRKLLKGKKNTASKSLRKKAGKTLSQKASRGMTKSAQIRRQRIQKMESCLPPHHLHQGQLHQKFKTETGRKQRCLDATNAIPSTYMNVSESASAARNEDVLRNLPDSDAIDSTIEVIQEVITSVVVRFPDGSVRKEVYRRVLK